MYNTESAIQCGKLNMFTVFHKSPLRVPKQKQSPFLILQDLSSVGGILAHQGLHNQTVFKKKKKKRQRKKDKKRKKRKEQITSFKGKNGLAAGHSIVQKKLMKYNYKTAAAGLFCKEEIRSGIQTI